MTTSATTAVTTRRTTCYQCTVECGFTAKIDETYETRGFKTPSGKIEFESEELRRHGYAALPVHARIQIHPDDASARDIADADAVLVSSPRGAVTFRAWVTDVVAPGVVHAFHGWAGANVNDLTNDATLDPISGFPAFKSSLCQVQKA